MIRRCLLRQRLSQQLIQRHVYQCATRVSCRAFSSQEDMEHLLKNPYLSKYADKLRSLQQTDPEAFQSRLEELEKSYKKAESRSGPDSSHSSQGPDNQHRGQTKTKNLDSILKLDLIQDKTAEEIEEIWKEYHKTKDCVFAVIPAAEFKEMSGHAREYPSFLYPLPRGEGYEFYFQQFNGDNCHYTPLIMYQTHKADAPPCLTLEHYTDIMEEKGIVLMRGLPDKNILSPYEAQLLALQTKMYYGLHGGLKFNLVRMFNNSPSEFRHMDLIQEFENYKRDYKDFKENVLQ